MKILLTLFVLFFSSSSFANTIVLYCSDIEHSGYEQEDNYSKTANYTLERFKLKVDLQNNTIVSKAINLEVPICQKQEVTGWDTAMTCMDSFSFFTINLENFNYYRTVGFGFVMYDKDDLTSAYGTCEKF